MKRFHVHLAVENIEHSVAFYSQLFGRPPAKLRDDYAKWMLDDPRVNFAVSTRVKRAHVGVDHFGMQVETESELQEIRAHADAASGGRLLDEGAATCCYANSDKHWTLDPQGIAWEHFHTLSDSPTYQKSDGECCIPIRDVGEACCVPAERAGNDRGCC